MSNVALLHCETLDALMVVQRDDFITLGEVERTMSDHCTIKVRAILGASRNDTKEVRILNRYCVGTPMVEGIRLSMNQTFDMLRRV